MYLMKTPKRLLLSLAGLVLCGCQQAIIDRTDRSVYRAIEDRQRAALGITSNTHLGPETGRLAPSERVYDLVPHPLGPELPEAFRGRSASPSPIAPESPPESAPPDAASETATQRSPEETDPPPLPAEPEADNEPAPANRQTEGPELPGGTVTTEPSPLETELGETELSPSIFSDEELDEVIVFGLGNALAYATAHARELQSAKEDLYFAGLDLTLERHLWTPQFVASIQGEFADYGQVRDFDRAMTVVSDVAVRLPPGC